MVKTLKDVMKLHTLAEAKLVLAMMKLENMPKGNLHQLSDITGLSIPEVSQGAQMLKVLGINKSRNFNEVEITKEWSE